MYVKNIKRIHDVTHVSVISHSLFLKPKERVLISINHTLINKMSLSFYILGVFNCLPKWLQKFPQDFSENDPDFVMALLPHFPYTHTHSPLHTFPLGIFHDRHAKWMTSTKTSCLATECAQFRHMQMCEKLKSIHSIIKKQRRPCW